MFKYKSMAVFRAGKRIKMIKSVYKKKQNDTNDDCRSIYVQNTPGNGIIVYL